MVFCSKCGSAITGSVDFCPGCGQPISSREEEIGQVKYVIREVEAREVFESNRGPIREYYLKRLQELESPKGFQESKKEPAPESVSAAKRSGALNWNFAWERNVRLILVLGVFTFILALAVFIHSQWIDLQSTIKVAILAFSGCTSFVLGMQVDKRWHLPATASALMALGSALLPITVFTAVYYDVVAMDWDSAGLAVGVAWFALNAYFSKSYKSELLAFGATIALAMVFVSSSSLLNLKLEKQVISINLLASLLILTWYYFLRRARVDRSWFALYARPLQWSAHLFIFFGILYLFWQMGGASNEVDLIGMGAFPAVIYMIGAIQLRSRFLWIVSVALQIQTLDSFNYMQRFDVIASNVSYGLLSLCYFYGAAWWEVRKRRIDRIVVRWGRFFGFYFLFFAMLNWLIDGQWYIKEYKVLLLPIIGALAALSYMRRRVTEIPSAFFIAFVFLFIYKALAILAMDPVWGWTIISLLTFGSSFLCYRYREGKHKYLAHAGGYGILAITTVYLFSFSHFNIAKLLAQGRIPLVLNDLIFAATFLQLARAFQQPFAYGAVLLFSYLALWLGTASLNLSIDILLPLNSGIILGAVLFYPLSKDDRWSIMKLIGSVAVVLVTFLTFGAGMGGFLLPQEKTLILTCGLISTLYFVSWTMTRLFTALVLSLFFGYLSYWLGLVLYDVSFTEAYSTPLGVVMIILAIERHFAGKDFHARFLLGIAILPLLLPSLMEVGGESGNLHALCGLLNCLLLVFSSMCIRIVFGVVLGFIGFILILLVKAFEYIHWSQISKAQWGMAIGAVLILIGILAEMYRKKVITFPTDKVLKWFKNWH